MNPPQKVKLLKNLANLALLFPEMDLQGNQRCTINLWGTGNPYREFLYVDDLAAACVYVLQNIEFKDLVTEGKPVINTHINIGTGNDLRIRELARLISRITGFQWRAELG